MLGRLEQLVESGQADALEELIAQASGLRAGWRMGQRKQPPQG
jgi:hypothetical protein